jgi:hypothetical protein
MCVVALAALSAWLAVRFLYNPPDPTFAGRLGVNAFEILNPIAMAKNGALVVSVAAALLISVRCAAVGPKMGRIEIAAWIGGAAAAAALLHLVQPLPAGRYSARGLVVLSMFALGAAAAVLSFAPTRTRAAPAATRQFASIVLTGALASLAAQAAAAALFLNDWAIYRQAMRAAVNEGPPGPIRVASLAPVTRRHPPRTQKIIAAMNWGWPLVYQSVVFGEGYRPRRIILSGFRSTVISCATAERVLRGGESTIPQSSREIVVDYVCGRLDRFSEPATGD